MRAPDRRASLSAIATACFRLRTFDPDEDLSDPRLYSPITFLTFPRPLRRLLVAARFVLLADRLPPVRLFAAPRLL